MKKVNEKLAEEVLTSFADQEHDKESLRSPFSKFGYIFATDSYIMCYLKQEHTDYLPEMKAEAKYPDPTRILPEENCSLIIDLKAADLEKYRNVKVKKEIECGCCNGDGKIESELEYKGKEHTYTFECPVCSGSGIEETIETGEIDFGNYSYCKIGETYFKMSYFYKMLKLAEKMKAELMMIGKDRPIYAHLFQAGPFKILLMPCDAHNVDYKKAVVEVFTK